MGVSKYSSGAIQDLPFVDNDLADLGGSLTEIGYGVTIVGGPGKRSPTRGEMLASITEFCRHGVEENEVALLYFSGHGLHHRGKNYLVPADGELTDGLIEDLMVPVDFAATYEESPASAIFFFVDACREGVDFGEKSLLSYQEWSRGKIEAMKNRQSAYVFACRAGEVSRYVDGPDNSGFSLFSKALSETLTDNRSALGMTFGRLRTGVQERVDELASKHQLETQHVRVVAEGGATEDELAAVRISAAGPRRGSTQSSLPTVDIEAIRDLTIEDDDLRLLSQNQDKERPWIEGAVPITHVLRSAAALRKPFDAVLERLGQFEPVGVKAPKVDAETAAAIEVEHDDLILLPLSGEGERGADSAVEVPALHVLYAASKLGRPVDEILARLGRFEKVGVKGPEIDPGKVKGLMVDDKDLTVLSQDLDGQPPWLQGKVPVHHLLRVAARFGVQVGEVVSRLEPFEPFDIVVPAGLDEAAQLFTLSEEEVRLLSKDLNGRDPWVASPIPIGHVLLVACKEGETVGEAAERLRRFEVVGWEIPTIPEAAAGLEVPENDLVLVSSDFDGRYPWLDAEVRPARLANASFKFGEPVGKVCERVLRYQALGLSHPEVDAKAVADLVITREDMVVLTGRQVEDWTVASEDFVPLPHVLFAANRLDETVDQAAARLDRLQAVGISVEEVDWAAVKGLRIDAEDLKLVSGDLDGVAPWMTPELGWPHLLRAAQKLNEPLGGIVERVKKLEPLGYTVPAAELDQIADLAVTLEDLVVLAGAFDEPSSGQPSVVRLLRASSQLEETVGDVIARLTRFEPLGIQLPEIDDPDALTVQVAEDDLLLLSADFDGLAPWVEATVPVGNVLATAAAGGKTVGEVLKRVAQFEPFGFGTPEVSERGARQRVNAEDLVLLSRDRNGSPPWVEREIPVVHLLQASSTLEESVGETLRRLQKLESAGAISLTSFFAETSRPWRPPPF